MNVILTGGGTAGHVSPAIAVAEEIMIREPGAKILFIGREGGGENEAVRKAGIPLATLKIQGIRRKITLDNAKSVYYALRAFREARKIIQDFEPDVILGTGGYVCWPVIRAGQRLNIPTAIHESNATPGLTTRLLSKKCDKDLVNHSDTKQYLKKGCASVEVGNPLRRGFKKENRSEARKELALGQDDVFILSFGGSIGAQRLNEAVIGVMEEYSARESNVKHIHAVGKRYFESVKDSKFIKGACGCKIVDYIDNMPTLLSAADIVIARAGAMTISEIASVGVAAILIPSPNVSDNHQFKNAKKLSDEDAAVLIEEKNLTAESLKSAVKSLKNDKNARKNKAKNISHFSTPNSAKLIVNELKMLISGSFTEFYGK